MRRWMQSISALTLAHLFLAGVAYGGGETAKTAGEKTAEKKECSVAHGAKAGEHACKLEPRRISELRNMKVLTKQGEQFGTIENMIIDVDHGRVAYAVISHGGILGMGDKDVLLPFVTLRCKGDAKELRTKATIEQLKQAEGFDDENLDQVRKLSDAAFAERFHRQFDVRPYWQAQGHSKAMKKGEASAAEKKEQGAERKSEEARTEGPASGSGMAAHPGQKTHKNTPGEMVLMSTLLDEGGVKVKAKDGVAVGHLNNLIVDLNRGHIGYAIVNRESELVPENQLCAVPWELIRVQRVDPRPDVIAEAPVAKIKDAPGFSAGQWPDMAKTDWNERTNAYFDATPYYVMYGYVLAPEPEEYASFTQGGLKTCTGTIRSFDRDAEGGLVQGDEGACTARIELKEGQQLSPGQEKAAMATVILAPSSFLSSKGLDLREGQEITVKGWLSSRTDMLRVIAMSVQAGDKTVELRNSGGHPQWKTP